MKKKPQEPRREPPAGTEALGILVVEDVASMRQLVEHLIGMIPGLRVSGSAKNTPEARIELTRRRPALVLLDEILPGESSHDLLAEMKALGLPVLLMTGLRDAEHPLPAGAGGRLVKPTWETIDEDRERFRVAILAAIGTVDKTR